MTRTQTKIPCNHISPNPDKSRPIAHLHPRTVGGIEAAVERDGVVDVGTEGAGDIHHGHSQGRRGVLLARRVELADDVEVRASHVAVDEEGEIRRVHPALEVVLVHLYQVVVPLLGALEFEIRLE